MDIASFGAGPLSPASIARSASDNCIKANYNPPMRKLLLAALASVIVPLTSPAQTPPAAAVTILKPARVFDGDTMHEGWAVRVKGDRIEAVGTAESVAATGATVVDLPGTTLMPGLVEGHSHILLHAYSETSWTDQV